MSQPPIPHADAVCEGGDLDCGSGLLLIIREAFEPLRSGGVLEIRSSEISVKEDLPAWCRMVGHTLLAAVPAERRSVSYFVRKSGDDAALGKDLQSAADFRWQVRAGLGSGGLTRVFARNHSFDVGQPASFDTADAAPSAIELLLGALAADLLAGLRWRASRVGLEFAQIEFSLSASDADPRVFLGLSEPIARGLSRIEGRMYVQTEADPARWMQCWQETLGRSLIARTLQAGTQLSLEVKCMP